MSRSSSGQPGVSDVAATFVHDLADAHAPMLWKPHRPSRPAKSEGGRPFRLVSDYSPAGDQPTAIRELVAGIQEREHDQVLLGVTGSGKTFTMASIIAETQRPALILAPNKTLAAQLYSEFKSFFPDNAVEYFVSYYDYYQLVADLVAQQYKRNDASFERGTLRKRGDTVEIFPAHYEDRAWRIQMFGDEVETIQEFDPLTGKKTQDLPSVKIYANSHYV